MQTVELRSLASGTGKGALEAHREAGDEDGVILDVDNDDKAPWAACLEADIGDGGLRGSRTKAGWDSPYLWLKRSGIRQQSTNHWLR